MAHDREWSLHVQAACGLRRRRRPRKTRARTPRRTDRRPYVESISAATGPRAVSDGIDRRTRVVGRSSSVSVAWIIRCCPGRWIDARRADADAESASPIADPNTADIEQRSCHRPSSGARERAALRILLLHRSGRRRACVVDVREELLRALPKQPGAEQDHERRITHPRGGALLRARGPGIRSHTPRMTLAPAIRQDAARQSSETSGPRRRPDRRGTVMREQLEDELRVHDNDRSSSTRHHRRGSRRRCVGPLCTAITSRPVDETSTASASRKSSWFSTPRTAWR